MFKVKDRISSTITVAKLTKVIAACTAVLRHGICGDYGLQHMQQGVCSGAGCNTLLWSVCMQMHGCSEMQLCARVSKLMMQARQKQQM